MVGRVLETVAQLADQPGLGSPERVHGTRELVVSKTRYIVPYRVRGDTVKALRVFLTSRRYRSVGRHARRAPPRVAEQKHPRHFFVSSRVPAFCS